MKKYQKDLIIMIIQLAMFYLFPITSGPTDMMGLVLILVMTTFALSITIILISNNKIKYLYPIIVSLLFIPSVFIYYNETALIHSVWYFVISVIGAIIGTIISKIIKTTKGR